MPRSVLNHALVQDHELGLNHSANTTIAIGADTAPPHADKYIGHNTYIGHGVAKLAVASTAVLQHNTAIGSSSSRKGSEIARPLSVDSSNEPADAEYNVSWKPLVDRNQKPGVDFLARVVDKASSIFESHAHF